MVGNIKKIKDFDAFFKASTRARGKCVNVSWAQSEKHEIEVAFIASKASVSKQANQRNRAKRRLRAAFALASKDIKTTYGGLQIAFICHRHTLKCPWETLLLEVVHHIKTAQAPKNGS